MEEGPICEVADCGGRAFCGVLNGDLRWCFEHRPDIAIQLYYFSIEIHGDTAFIPTSNRSFITASIYHSEASVNHSTEFDFSLVKTNDPECIIKFHRPVGIGRNYTVNVFEIIKEGQQSIWYEARLPFKKLEDFEDVMEESNIFELLG